MSNITGGFTDLIPKNPAPSPSPAPNPSSGSIGPVASSSDQLLRQSEQKWVDANPDLSKQLFGDTWQTGQVAQFVNQWYQQNPQVQPDAIDGPILANQQKFNQDQAQLAQQSQQNPQGQMEQFPVVSSGPQQPETTQQPATNFNPFTATSPQTTTSSPADSQIGASINNLQNQQVQQPNLPVTPTVNTPVVSSNGQPSNYNQTQAGNQMGAFSSAGSTDVNQVQASNQISNQQQNTDSVTNQNQITGNNQVQQGNTNTTGTTVSAPIDTLGFGSLLQGSAPQAQANDATRTGFLNDLVKTGGSAMQGQTDQAIRNSLTGPQMTGAGDSAQARASGYAAAQVARNNTDQRLNAAQQLAGPSSLSTLSTSANPYIGSAQVTNNNQNTTGTTNQTGFSNLVGNTNTAQNTASQTQGLQSLASQTNEANSGLASGQSSQAAVGLVPQTQQVSGGGGGCVLCTAAVELGFFHNLRVLRKVISYKLSKKKFESASKGYFFLFTPLAKFLLSHPFLAYLLYPMARAVVYEELRVSGVKLPRKPWPSLVHWSGHFLCHIIGKFPVPGRVTDPVIESIARKNNIWFEVKS